MTDNETGVRAPQQRCASCHTAASRRVRTRTSGTGGMGRKADANQIVPLCPNHHRALHTIGRASFEALYHISLDVHARLTDARWQAYAQANGRTTETGEVA